MDEQKGAGLVVSDDSPRALNFESAEAYGQAPVTMSAPGPAFFHVAEPTVLWMQYVTEFAD